MQTERLVCTTFLFRENKYAYPWVPKRRMVVCEKIIAADLIGRNEKWFRRKK